MSSELEADRSRLLYELACAFAARLELPEVIDLVVTRCREVLGAEGVSVLLLDEETDELYFPYVISADPATAGKLRGLRIPADSGIAGATLASGRAEVIADVSKDPRWYGGVDKKTGLTTGSLLSAPLLGRRGRIGVLQVVSGPDRGPFSPSDLAFVEALAASIAIAIDNASMYGELGQREALLRERLDVLQRDLTSRERFREIVGTAPAMREVFDLMETAAASPIAVLVQGATGTGKELVARGIHQGGARASGPFLAVNCSALPADLLETELFGHVRGAFTGATSDRRGLFEAATGGTVFLDEVGELPASMQPKLLRVLQEGEVTPVGTSTVRKVDVRLVSATNRDLEAEVRAGRFRADLFYRLAAFPIVLPLLRERSDDIPLLVDHFLRAAASRQSKPVLGIEPEAVELLMAYPWPGNIRELENEVERAVALTSAGSAVAARALSLRVREAAGFKEPSVNGPHASDRSGGSPSAAAHPAALSVSGGEAPAAPLREARREFEAAYIRAALERTGGNVTHTAAALGISRVMLQKKMKQLGLR